MRSTHPIILAILKRDRELREAGKAHGLWTVEEAAGVMGAARMSIYRLIEANQLESTQMGTRTKFYLRITSASMIAFVINNTTGPDEAAICNNLEKLLRTLTADALNHLADYIATRQHLLSGGEKPAPRRIRRLADALDPNAPTPTLQDSEPDLFANLTPAS